MLMHLILKRKSYALALVCKHLHLSAFKLRVSGQSFRPPPREHKSSSNSEVLLVNDVDDQEDDAKTIKFVQRVSFTPEMGHQTFVIQPFVKWGVQKITGTTPTLQLQEAITLAETLPDWKVVKSVSLFY